MEDVVYEILDHRQVPSRTDFKDIRSLVDSLRGQVTGTASGVRRLAEQHEDLDERIHTLERRITVLESRLTSSFDELAVLSSNESPKSQARTCQVPDCDEAHRSKGFCARHYQQWRRGRLDLFPYPG